MGDFLVKAMKLRFVIQGEPASKANQRRLVTLNAKPALIKSRKALSYEQSALQQIPMWARVMWDKPCGIRLRIYYTSERPDLDESIILDCLQARYATVKRMDGSQVRFLLQAGVVTNDRCFRQKHVYHEIDRRNPRTEVTVWRLDGQGELV